MPITLNEIVKHKQGEVTHSKKERPVVELQECVATAKPPRNFFGAVVNGHTRGSTSVIAEIKRKSPSAGLIRDDFDVAAIATAYEKAGAAAISCLTDEHFFGGKLAFIEEIRGAVSLPVLRKDFIVDEYQIWEARAAGADAVLLIAEVLAEGQLLDYLILAHELRMTSLVEAHSMDQLLRVQSHVGFPHKGYCLLGINNRNLKTMTTDITHTIRMVDVVEDKSVLVSESGISKPEDLDKLRQHGVHIVLVGESLMKEPDPGQALATLIRMNCM
ncbi:MAG: indole-3-glycerol phosphate synthase TrpC [Phycisphaerales bacterium]|jgi:indole-3-glycerol phosphate synthase|nr:indole-3-glycerol phosphate synthase TrpC [Phycisphaerales bacterium]